ncbi:MAG: hypothetical protein IKE11_08565 [Clostridia bacterium]|nr:hypothetical protein [Clostridia bacterium]
MDRINDAGVFQFENGLWAYRFVIVVESKQITKRITTDEFGNALKTKKQAIKAKENAMVAARMAGDASA